VERTILNSWKEIAMYVGRGVRTVQRYELRLGFPVRRPAGMFRGSVMAFSDEIDAWLNRAPTQWQQIVNQTSDSRSVIRVSLDGHHSGENTATCPLCLGSGKIPHSDSNRAVKHEKATEPSHAA
jgi:hypothetical protein